MHWLNPDQLPHVTSNVERFLVNPHGDADGMILTNGMEVHCPPHLSAEILAAIRPGDRISVYGVQPRITTMIAAVAIETADGTRIVDKGPPKHEKERREPKHEAQPSQRRKFEVEGFVRCALHGPKGETRGALLHDGTIVRFSPREADALAELLSPGSPLAARGEGLVTPMGTVIEAQEIGPSAESVRPIKPKKPKHDRSDKHDGKDERPAHVA